MKFDEIIKIKSMITPDDVANVVETVADFVFKVRDGKALHTPYFLEDGLRFAIIAYLLDGITIEDDDDILNDAYANVDVVPIVEAFAKTEAQDMIIPHVRSVVDFRMKEYLYRPEEIHRLVAKAVQSEVALNEAALTLAKNQNTAILKQIEMNEYNEAVLEKMSPAEIAELNRKLISGEMNYENIANIAIEKYLQTDKHDQEMVSVIAEKNKKIRELEAYKAEAEARKE